MPIRQRFDRLLLGATILQLTVGLAIMASASWLIATERYGRPGTFFFTWQAATAVVGLGLMIAAMHLRADLLIHRQLTQVGLGVSWILLVLTFFQAPVAQTHRWLVIGGLSLQPSVVARVALIAFAAVELDRARRADWAPRELLPLFGASVVTGLLIVAEPDLGSATLVLMVVAAMAWVAGVPRRLFAVPGVLGLLALVVAVAASPYRLRRVLAFLDPGSALAAGWQSTQSLVAVGSGGLFGRGYASSLQKLFFLPEPHTDFIFAITGEELGLAGLVVLLGLVAVIAWRGLRIAAGQEVPGAALLAFGLTFAFAAQSLIHMAVCLDLLPPKGIPLPLVSYGKTDLVVSLVALGLILNLSREARA